MTITDEEEALLEAAHLKVLEEETANVAALITTTDDSNDSGSDDAEVLEEQAKELPVAEVVLENSRRSGRVVKRKSWADMVRLDGDGAPTDDSE